MGNDLRRQDSHAEEATDAGGNAEGEVAEGDEEEDEEEHLGLKRELVARTFRDLMVDMYGRLEIAFGEPNKDALEAGLILALVQMCECLLSFRDRVPGLSLTLTTWHPARQQGTSLCRATLGA